MYIYIYIYSFFIFGKGFHPLTPRLLYVNNLELRRHSNFLSAIYMSTCIYIYITSKVCHLESIWSEPSTRFCWMQEGEQLEINGTDQENPSGTCKEKG